jgi:7-cyano-7-deazaguanine synthase
LSAQRIRIDRNFILRLPLTAMSTPTPTPAAPAPPSAVVLLSGGLDSATLLAVARRQGFRCHCLSFAYGQRHAVELDAARRVARQQQAAAHRTIEIDLRAFGGSALTADLAVPKDRSAAAMAGDIPITYVPARNTIFLAYALGWAEVLEAGAIFIGVNAVDYSGYPDCRPEFVRAFQGVADVATKAAVEGRPARLITPLIHLTKAQIILTGVELGVDYSLTHSCYDPVGDLACGRCDSCLIRRQGFADARVPDPTRYVAER